MKSITFVTTISRLAILALLLPAGMLAAQNADSAAITTLLGKVKSHVVRANDAAHELEGYTRSDIHHTLQAEQLTLIKENVNNLIKDADEMSSLRAVGSPWQKEAIDHIQPLLPEIAAHLTATIEHFNDNLNRTQMKAYRDLVRNNQLLISEAHEIIKNWMDYSKTKARAEALEKQLQLPAAEETGS